MLNIIIPASMSAGERRIVLEVERTTTMNAAALRILLGAVASVALLSAPLAAQSVPDSIIGSRVRIMLTKQPDGSGRMEQQSLIGSLAAIGGDSLYVRVHPAAAPLGVALQGIDRVDLSRGISRVREALHNGVGGAAIYGALGYAARPGWSDSRSESALIGAGVGFVAGVLSGALFPDERWTSIFER